MSGHFHACPTNYERISVPVVWKNALKNYFADPRKCPLLVWGDHNLSAQAVEALHGFGYNVLETWPGDTLTSNEGGFGAAGNAHSMRLLLETLNQRSLFSTRRTVLLVSDVDHICHTGRAALAEAYKLKQSSVKLSKQKRKRGEESSQPSSKKSTMLAPLVVCTCSDYYAPSMRTVMHKLVPVAKSVKMHKSQTSGDRLQLTPWDAVLAVRRRPICPKTSHERMRADEADQYMRSMPCVMATLHENLYDLNCRAERWCETQQKYTSFSKKEAETLRQLERMSNVAEHVSDCDMLTRLVERKHKLHADDDDPTFAARDGQEAKSASLAMGLSLRKPFGQASTLKTVLFPPNLSRGASQARANQPLNYYAALNNQRNLLYEKNSIQTTHLTLSKMSID